MTITKKFTTVSHSIRKFSTTEYHSWHG